MASNSRSAKPKANNGGAKGTIQNNFTEKDCKKVSSSSKHLKSSGGLGAGSAGRIK